MKPVSVKFLRKDKSKALAFYDHIFVFTKYVIELYRETHFNINLRVQYMQMKKKKKGRNSYLLQF